MSGFYISPIKLEFTMNRWLYKLGQEHPKSFLRNAAKVRIKNEFREMNRLFSPGLTLGLGLFGLVRTVASLKCHVCIEKVNHVGDPIGISQDTGCLLGENLETHEQECADGEVCMVDILTDWLAEGRGFL